MISALKEKVHTNKVNFDENITTKPQNSCLDLPVLLRSVSYLQLCKTTVKKSTIYYYMWKRNQQQLPKQSKIRDKCKVKASKIKAANETPLVLSKF